MANPDWSVIDQYVKNLPLNSRSYRDYESAKRWFKSQYVCDCSDYTKFTTMVIRRLGI